MIKWFTRCPAISLYLLSMAVPAYNVALTDGTVKEVHYGLIALLIGWLGIFLGNAAWLANLAFAIAVFLLMFHRIVAARILFFASLLLAISAIGLMTEPFIGDEGGITRKILQPRLGYYIWMSSMLFGTLFPLLIKKNKLPALVGQP